ncbi:MAG: Secreted protein [Pedosphaera sp.]|nr:Secreted protein [Pedosphaera sp.]
MKVAQKLLGCGLVLFLYGAFAGCSVPTSKPVIPLIHAHAHNDYAHRHPLFDALEQGFCSVEADIHLVDGKLLVAHDTNALDPQRTLQSLYLEPLRARVKQNGGRVYPNGPECVLLIDFKTEAKTTYAALCVVLKEYSDILSVFRDGKKETNAITAILTGPYPRVMLAADAVRYAAGDGKLLDLDKNPSSELVPWISENWKKHFKWDGKGVMAAEEKQKLKQIVAKAHQQGRQVRFWNAPDQENFWTELLVDEVDLINTDDLKGVRKFYDAR